ncbi:MAG TPA: C1 family peptidase [Polyangiaceae bacterium]
MRRSIVWALFAAFGVVASLEVSGCKAGSSAAAVDAGPAALAPKDTSPAKKPPPVRASAARLKAPALPDLPTLASHEPPSPTPPSADLSSLGDHPCRAVWTGLDTAPLACARALFFGSHGADSGDGAKVLVPRTLLARDPAALPAVCDHRIDGTEGPVRDQGSAPACTAFATATALDHAMARWGGTLAASSAMQIWSRYHSPEVDTSLVSNLGQPIGPERTWPFDVREAVSWIPCTDLSKPVPGKCGRPVDDARLKTIMADPIGNFTEVEYVATPPDIPTLRAKIAAGQDVIVAMELPTTFVAKGKAGARYVPHYTKSGGPDAGHALVLAGYAAFPHGTYFLAHNSWGTRWGDGGYAWIHEATISAWAREVVVLDAEPVDGSGRTRRDRGTTTCAAGLLPDSIRAVCTPPCPDGSPRHDGVCAVAGQCPADYVNLSGACVLAAPKAQGSDPATKITWACGPGGCAYWLPRASDPSCTGSVCQASCPAPDFRLASMGSALVCVE